MGSPRQLVTRVFHVNFNLLVARCLYFACLISFNFGTISDEVVIEIPQQEFLTCNECSKILLILSIRNSKSCFELFHDVSLEALIFFSSFFQSDFIADYIMTRIVMNLNDIPRILKMLRICFGTEDYYFKTALMFVSEHLKIPVYKVLTLQEDKKNSGQYTTSRLGKKIRDIARYKALKSSKYEIKCVFCHEDIVYSYKGPSSKVLYLKCCFRPVHEDYCFVRFLQDTYKEKLECNFCRTAWFCGDPILYTLYKDYNRSQSMQYLTYQFEHCMLGTSSLLHDN